MRHFFCLIALVTITLAAQVAPPTRPGQPGLPRPPQQTQEELKPEDYCTLSGRVTNAATGEPLKKAQISLQPIAAAPGRNFQPANTTTDAAGNYAMKDIEPGRYRLSVTRAGYARQEYGARAPNRPGSTLTLEKSQRMKDVDFKLIPGGVISGRVLDEDGEPVAWVGVQVLRYMYIQQTGKQLNPVGGSSTDDRGMFRIHSLTPGKYYLSAVYRGDMNTFGIDRSAAQSPDEGYAATYYPGTLDPTTAAMLEVTPGGEIQGVEIRLLKTRVSRIRGKVTGGDPTLYQGRTSLMLMAKNSNMREGRGIIDAKGNFEIRNVTPGSYILRADQFSQELRISGQAVVEVGAGDVEGVILNLAPGLALNGVVRTGDTPADLSRLNIFLRPREGGMMGGAGARGKEDGSFRIPMVQPGTYDVLVAGLPEDYYVKSIAYGQEEALHKPLVIQQGVAAALDIVAEPGAARLTGVVKNDDKKPAQGATVVLEPLAENRRDLYKVATTDQNGTYNFAGIAPGDYRLYAFEDMEPGAYNDRDYLKDYEKQSEKITLAARESKQHEAVWIPAAKMQLR